MPYAIFSKRTGVVNRIVDNLVGMLPSESMIEMDDEINYPRGYPSKIEGQDVNSSGFPLFFLEGSGSSTINPQFVDYDPGDDRPFYVRNKPIYVAPIVPGGDRVTQWVDIPLLSNPFVWTKNELAQQKYESILAQNYPYQVIVGEEFIDDTHIDTGTSSGYVLSEGRCIISPHGLLQTTWFNFQVSTQGVIDPAGASDEDARTYVFDTYYLSVEPDFPSGVQVQWEGTPWTVGADVGPYDAVMNEDYPTTKLDGAATTATLLRAIRLKIQNLTTQVYAMENFMLMLRVRNLPI